MLAPQQPLPAGSLCSWWTWCPAYGCCGVLCSALGCWAPAVLGTECFLLPSFLGHRQGGVIAKRCPGRSRLHQRHCSRSRPRLPWQMWCCRIDPLTPVAGQGMGQTVLASQDPWGILHGTGAKGQWREMDSLIWALTPASQGCSGAGAQCPSAAAPTAGAELDQGGQAQEGC